MQLNFSGRSHQSLVVLPKMVDQRGVNRASTLVALLFLRSLFSLLLSRTNGIIAFFSDVPVWISFSVKPFPAYHKFGTFGAFFSKEPLANQTKRPILFVCITPRITCITSCQFSFVCLFVFGELYSPMISLQIALELTYEYILLVIQLDFHAWT